MRDGAIELAANVLLLFGEPLARGGDPSLLSMQANATVARP